MTNESLVRLEREAVPGRSRGPVALAAAAVLGLSLLVSVGPALAAAKNGDNGNGTAGSSNIKVHDASTGTEGLGSDNEPHVCDFWLEFSMPAPYEAGSWLLLSWAPTGNGSTVAAGTYNTAGDGVDSTSVIHVPAGHYRAEWAATGQSATKKKTFWVDSGCDAATSQAEETQAAQTQAESAQGDQPSESVQDSPAEESPMEEPASLADEPAGSTDQSLAETPAETPAATPTQNPTAEPPTDESAVESSADETSTPAEQTKAEDPTADESPTGSNDQDVLSETGSGDESPAEADAPVNEPSDEESAGEPAVGGSASPSADAPASSDESAAAEQQREAPDGAASQPGSPPAQDQLDSHDDLGGSTIPDTAASPQPVSNGLVVTLMLLLLVAAHAGFRSSRSVDRD